MEICRRLSVDLTVLDADLPRSGGGLRVDEATARAARYEAFKRFVSAGDVLCTAHSEDDHIETVLLNLFRGAGPRGISGIPDERRLGEGMVARPVRAVSRAALLAYARRSGLSSIDDPANDDLHFSRVVLRRRVIPVLESQWPGLRATLARAAELGRESAEMLVALATVDLESAGGIHSASLDATVVGALPPARRRNAIAGWLRVQGIVSPGVRRIEQIARTVIESRQDAMPCVRLGDIDVRRFRGRVRLVPRSRPVAARSVQWRVPEVLEFEHGRLGWERCREGGLDDMVLDTQCVVRFRGEDASWMRPLHVRGRSLKKRFQTLGIPPWERGRIPLIYAGGELAAIGAEWINPRLAAAPEMPGWSVVWTPRSMNTSPRPSRE